MYEDVLDCSGRKCLPPTAVLLTGDGAGIMKGLRLHAALTRMLCWGWTIEVLAWEGSCNKTMKQWVLQNGSFVSLDKYYQNITFREPGEGPDAQARPSQPLHLEGRPGLPVAAEEDWDAEGC